MLVRLCTTHPVLSSLTLRLTCPTATTSGTAALCCALEYCAVCRNFIYTSIGTLSSHPTILVFILGSIPPLLWSVLMYIPSFPSLLCWLCAIFHTSLPSSCISLASGFISAANILFLRSTAAKTNHLNVFSFLYFFSLKVDYRFNRIHTHTHITVIRTKS